MRLSRTLVTTVVCAASLAAAAPAQAKPGNGHGKAQRCQAAQNGKHNGFVCETSTGVVRGRCPDGFFATPAAYGPDADLNGNEIVCQSFTEQTWVDDDPRGN